MKTFLLMICAFLFTVTASASELPEPDRSSQSVGMAWVYERENGTRYRSTLIAMDANGDTFENREGEDGSGSLISRSIYNKAGKMVEWSGPGADDTWVYTPSYCTRTLGDCTYKVKKASGGKSYRNTVSTKYDGKRATWKRYYNGNVVGSGWYELDPETAWVSSFHWSRSGGRSETAKLLRIEKP